MWQVTEDIMYVLLSEGNTTPVLGVTRLGRLPITAVSVEMICTIQRCEPHCGGDLLGEPAG